MSEHDEQAALVQWAQLQTGALPELAMLFAIPNGGARHIAVARKLKAEGVVAGTPDLFLACARRGYHGLFIEMKHGKNKATPAQVAFIDAAREQGYRAGVCYGFDEARDLVEWYLGVTS